MASGYLKITSPDGLYIETGGSLSCSIPPADSFTAQSLNATYTSAWNVLGDESLATNPARLNSMAEYYWNSVCQFRGRVRGVSRVRTGNGTSTVTITAYSPMADLSMTAAGTDAGGETFLQRQAITTLTGKRLYPGVAEPDCEAPYFAAFGADAWAYHADSLPSALLNANTAIGSTELVTQSTADQGFPPRGYVCVSGGQLCYYDGYHPASVGGLYTFYNVAWGKMGTSGGANPATEDTPLYYAKPFPIAASTPPALQGEYDVTPLWEEIASGWYTVRAEEGRFDFKGDPTAAPFSYLAIHGTFDVIDEQDASRVLVADLVADILEYTGESGPALSAADYSITIDDIPLPKEVRLTSGSSTLAVLQGITSEVQASAYNSAYKIGFQYDAATGVFEMGKIAQATTPDVYIGAAISMSEALSIEGYGTAAKVQYNRAAPSLISPSRMWHPAVGDQIKPGSEYGVPIKNVQYIYYQQVDQEMAQGWNPDSTVSNNLHTQFLMDGNDSTGWGIGCAETAGAHDIDVIYAWFTAAQIVERVRLIIDFRRALIGEHSVTVYGLTSYTPGTPPTIGDYIKLSDALSITVGAQRSGMMEQGITGWVDRAVSGRLLAVRQGQGRY
jgi:hypothetical protein